jgi:dTDP-4-dehydrorhamnose reductase
MRILVTGANGQLGRETVLALRDRGEEVVAVSRREIDFGAPEKVTDEIARHQADWVINCAAYTQVDMAEDNQAEAFKVNRDSAKAVAEGVRKYGGRLVHVSTDFIFDGRQSRPYKEDDVGNSLSVYGQSKWEGEQAVRESLPESLIVRTAWVYGVHGHNFVKTILRLAGERDELSVVDDQIGTPSWTKDIAEGMWALIDADASGIFNLTNEGVASWYDFAEEIVAQAKRLGMPVKAQRVHPIPTRAYATPARRPGYSVLNKEKIREILNYPIPHWTASLGKALEVLRDMKS